MRSIAAGDPRHFQIAVLVALVAYGIFVLDFEVRPGPAAAIAGAALTVQVLGCLLTRRPVELRSAWISTLSLCLLLRTASLETAVLAGALAIASKFALRVRGRHVFNPSAFGLAAVLLLREDAWLSAGQWGSGPLLALATACAGSLVLRRAQRSDVTWVFLGAYAALLFGRALWLGDPLAIPMHALESGAFLIFAFFMISDPRTTPDARAGRVVFAGLVAGLGFLIRFGLYETNGLLWSLVLCAPLVPLLDWWWPGRRAVGSDPARKRFRLPGGEHAIENELDPDLPGLAPVR